MLLDAKFRMGMALWVALLSVTGVIPGKAEASLQQGSRLLHIGDSHSVGPFGRVLSKNLLAMKEIRSLGFYGSCGALARSYLTGWKTPCGFFALTPEGVRVDERHHRTPRIEALLEGQKPELTVVELSTNYFMEWTRDRAVQDMRNLALLIRSSGSRCVWVSGPDTRRFHSRQAEMLDWVKETVGSECRVVDGASLTEYPSHGGDGIHYGSRSEVSRWVDEVLRVIREELRAE